jgi:hypothetical protein
VGDNARCHSVTIVDGSDELIATDEEIAHVQRTRKEYGILAVVSA